MNKFDKNLDISKIDCVIIENQLSSLANKMKYIQCIITQYFIMRNIHNIQYISAINKLKKYIGEKKTTYSERKKLSINITNEILKKSEFNKWITLFNNGKKDDLADCFLQALWYLEK